MTDREMLELAAKAAGLHHPDGFDWLKNELGYQWNPLEDDGDALRLAVKLGLTICNEHETAGVACCVRADLENFPEVRSGNIGDPIGITPQDYAATRRAITRAAADICKGMQ